MGISSSYLKAKLRKALHEGWLIENYISFLGNGTWGDWGDWSGCDVTCGEGERLRYRPCADTVKCVGNNVSHDTCMVQAGCPGTLHVVFQNASC